jgi:hypothetical protein
VQGGVTVDTMLVEVLDGLLKTRKMVSVLMTVVTVEVPNIVTVPRAVFGTVVVGIARVT